MNKLSLKRAASAEAVGVSSKKVQEFIDACMTKGKQLHSVMVVRHGEVACEAWRSPYASQYKHMMYSVSKSFTSAAIGIAIGEGILNLDTRFVDIFPETKKAPADENLEALTIKDLLTMRSGLSTTPMMDKTKESWFDTVLASKWVSKPGNEFLYISENMYLLCHVIHRLCNCSVMEYLQPRLFEPLGIENPFWETDKSGVEAGGWGMMLKTEDVAKFMTCILNGGVFNGKQLIPEWYVKEAISYQADTSVSKDSLDSSVGYGYCFWRCGGCEQAYRADGMFSQFGINFENYDATLVITAGEVNEQGMRDMIWPFFPAAFIKEDAFAPGIKISIPEYEKLAKRPRSIIESKIENKTIRLNKDAITNAVKYPLSVLSLPSVFMEAEKAGNINNVSFNFGENDCLMTWTEGEETNCIKIGLDGEYRYDTMTLGKIDYHTASIGAWTDGNELTLQIRPLETTSERILKFKFSGKRVTMIPSSNPSIESLVDSLKSNIIDVIKPEQLGEMLAKALPALAGIVEPTQKGTIS